MFKFYSALFIGSLLALASCNIKQEKAIKIFEKLEANQTNINFINDIKETDTLNILDYLYFYNGAGVASADFNNDGLEDIYFVSNTSSNKLYLNKGALKFEDITQKAGLAGSGIWKTGVTIVDINNDGYKDIYLSVVSGYKNLKGKNQLYINNKNLTFTESAAEYGIDFEGLSTQASFFDYDKDDDLDLLILTHSVHSNDTYGDSTLRFKYNEIAGDHLFRNDNGKFTDVTNGSGIYAAPIGYGLGISISDLNNDGWDDIYISNDFFEQDYYYINQQNGTFKEKLKDAFGHTSLFSMGNSVSDVNKDGYLDVISTDMLPEDIKILKSTINDEPLDIYNLEVKNGYYYQYSRNSLQLNVANGQKFIDVGLYAGVSATDWTWSPLVHDFDMDGRKDMFFSNGIKKRLNDLDYLKYLGDKNVFKEFGTDKKFDRNKIEMMPDGMVHNYLYHGDSLLKFTDISADNSMDETSSSAGSLAVDLDNDGDLDLVTNNMNQAAFIYKNNSIENDTDKKLKYVNLAFEYKGLNIDGIGTKIFVKSAQGIDHQEVQTSTAFLSSQSSVLNFTFFNNDVPKEALIIWPDNSCQIINKFSLNGKQTIKYDAKKVNPKTKDVSVIINDFLKSNKAFDYQDVEVKQVANLAINETPDFNYYSLLPHTYRNQTPPIAVADINNDGIDDVYIGGIAGEAKYLLIGKADKTFEKVNAFADFLENNDADAKWEDINSDGKPDLLVTNAEHPFTENQDIKPHRLYINLGDLKFKTVLLPGLNSLASKFNFIDVNADGLKDIFICSEVSFRDYSKKNLSHILLNKGNGNFVKTADDDYQDLKSINYIKEINVLDINKDGKDDLLISAEWQAPQIFISDKKGLKKFNSLALENLKGWWQSMAVADVDQDGKLDLIAGNWGLNNKYNVTNKAPLFAYYGDIDGNEKSDLILSYNFKGKHYPFRPKNDLEAELPYLKKEWLSYREMSDKTTSEIFKDRISEDKKLTANTFESVYISDFIYSKEIKPLPYLYQQAPITSLIKGSNKGEIIISGNFWGAVPYEGRYDALGLATLKFNKQKNQFDGPKYWINAALNFSELNYLKGLKNGNYLVLTNTGKLYSITKP